MAGGGPRRCLLGCPSTQTTLFSLPSDAGIRAAWLEFLHFDESGLSVRSRVCARHFTQSCFSNYGQYSAGLAKEIILTDTAVPTLYAVGAPSSKAPASGGGFCSVLPSVRHVASQTDPPETKPETAPQTRTVGTQLSIKTLQNAFRSTATQAKVPSRDCGVCTLTFPLDSPILFLQPTIVKRPSKRPRLSLKEEEEDPSESSLTVVENST
ncbi:uncharacterized protein LOC125016739 isoform X3 [Mugil cephalus]|uniref:uncharacterized protein LOC125016739 isoform X3 n=1 Tax=Mugil cephalus TaxID=48193 RepID=UPI001FB665A0|nr:uncharacterized protein LOC125016739 isoform X3 [Mugil cephalus]